MKKKFLIWSVLIFLCVMTTASVLMSFSNSLPYEELGFNGNSNIIRNLTLPKNAVVTSAFLNLSGYNFSSWQNNSNIVSGIPQFDYPDSNADPAIFEMDGTWYMIVSTYRGNLWAGYNWTGTYWQPDSNINNSLYKTCTYQNCQYSIEPFERAGENYLISTSSQMSGQLGLRWNGTGWENTSSIIAGLPHFNEGQVSIFEKDGTWYLLASYHGDAYLHGYNWTGSTWQPDSGIESGIGWVYSETKHTVFLDDSIWKLLVYQSTGAGIYSFNWSGTAWQVDDSVKEGLLFGIGTRRPQVFERDGEIYLATLGGDPQQGYNWSTSSPTFPVIIVNGQTIWNWDGVFNETYSPNATMDFSVVLNTALNGGACDCEGCVLEENNCSIPFIFHSNTVGSLNYSDLNVIYDHHPFVSMISPDNNSYIVNSEIFNCSVVDEEGVENVTFNFWDSSGVLNLSETISLTGIENSTTYNMTFNSSGVWTWGCSVFNNNSREWQSDNNFTITSDSIFPLIFENASSVDYFEQTIIIGVSASDFNFKNITYNMYSQGESYNFSSYDSLVLQHVFPFNKYFDNYYNVTICDLSGNCNSTSTTTIAAASTVIDKFNNSLITEQLNFSIAENITRYLKIYRDANIISGSIKISNNPLWISLGDETLGMVADGGLTAWHGADVFSFDGDTKHMLMGLTLGTWQGYTWNGSGWDINASVYSGLGDIGNSASPDVFERDGLWHFITGNWNSYIAYTWSGSAWVANNSLAAGLEYESESMMDIAVFEEGDSWYAITSETHIAPYTPKAYKWNGTIWIENSSIFPNAVSGSREFVAVWKFPGETSTNLLLSGTSVAKRYTYTFEDGVFVSSVINETLNKTPGYNGYTFFQVGNYLKTTQNQDYFGGDVIQGQTYTNSYSSSLSLEVGTYDAVQEWNTTTINSLNLSGTGEEINLTSVLNNALNGGACDCEGCVLEDLYCNIPFVFTSDGEANLTYSNITINSILTPIITIISPENGSYGSGDINFEINVTDDTPLNNTQLIIWKDSFPIYYWNATVQSFLNILNYTSSLTVTIINSIEFDVDGVYYWFFGAEGEYDGTEYINYLAYDRVITGDENFSITPENADNKSAADGDFSTAASFGILTNFIHYENFTKSSVFDNYSLNLRAGPISSSCHYLYASCFNSSGEWDNFILITNGVSQTSVPNSTKELPVSCIDTEIQIKIAGGRPCTGTWDSKATCLLEAEGVCLEYDSICRSRTCGSGGGAANYMWEAEILPYVRQQEKIFNLSNLNTLIIDSVFPLIENTINSENGIFYNKDSIFINVSASDANFKNITYYLYNSTGFETISSFDTLISEKTFTSLFLGTYDYKVEICDLAGNCNITNLTNVELSGPVLNLINPPSGGVYNIPSFPLNYTVSNVSNCYYNLTSGALSSINNEVVNCTNKIISIASEAVYTIDFWVIDYLGNIVMDSHVFTVELESGTGGGGGGSGETVTIIAGDNETQWSLTTETGGEKYVFIMIPGDSRTKPLIFKNLGESVRTISLACESEFEGFCDYLTFSDNDIELPVLKETDTSVDFIIALPKELENGNYVFNLLAIDDLNNTISLTINTNVGTSGVIVDVGSKFFTSTTIFGLEIPYVLLFFMVWPLIGVVGYFSIFKRTKLKGGKVWSLFLGLTLAFLTVVIL